MHGLVNENASCFIDAVIVALFVPRYNDVFVSRFFAFPEHLVTVDGAETGWEHDNPACSFTWRQHVRNQLLRLVQDMHANTSAALTVSRLRSFFALVPSGNINFGHAAQQSAVDFLQYLFNVFRIRDSLVSFQVSTTRFVARSEVADAGDNVSNLVRAWMSHPIVAKYTRENSDKCADSDDAAYLQRDKSGHAAILHNSVGDVRCIGHVQHASIFLCQLLSHDCVYTRVDKDLLPHTEHLSEQDGYTGTVATKLMATRLLNAPVLIIEVSRKVAVQTPEGFVERKVKTPVYYGDSNYKLDIYEHCFQLCAVVCHLGSARGDNGHYVTYVLHEQQWLFYDDMAALGEMVPVATLEPHASTNGELFFYTRCLV